MPALALAPGVVRIVFNGTISGTPWAAVMHSLDQVYSGTPPSQSALDATALGWRNAWVAQFIPRQAGSNVTLGAVTAQDLSTPTSLMGTAPGTTAGGKSGTSLPANVCMCISWRINLHYRGGHGRTYLCGQITADTANANSWATTELTLATTAANNFISAVDNTFGGRSSVFAILRRQANGLPLIPPVSWPVQSAVIDSRIDTMRRRLGKDR